MKKKFFLGFISFLSVFQAVFSQSVSSEILDKVKESGELHSIFLNNEAVLLSLVPHTELSSAAVSHWDSTEKPRLTIEKLFYLDKQSLLSKKNTSSDSDSLSIEKVSKVIRSISTMKGTEYYSNRHKKWETLYHETYLVKSKTEKVPVPDATDGSADGRTLYCMQNDNSFGKCYYELNYKQRQNEVSVCFDNFEPLKFGFITAAKAHNVKINLVVVDESDHFLVYLMVQAYYPKIAMLEDKMIDSFNARVDSIYKWFVAQMSK